MTEKIDLKKLLNFYNDTLSNCGIFLLQETDEVIKYNIYEDFDIGVHTFFHDKNIQMLYSNSLISKERLEKTITLRRKFINLQKTEDYKFINFKNSKNWKEIMRLCDELKSIK